MNIFLNAILMTVLMMLALAALVFPGWAIYKLTEMAAEKWEFVEKYEGPIGLGLWLFFMMFCLSFLVQLGAK